MYKGWADGKRIFLKFSKKSWEVEVLWLGGRCFFWKGWSKFVAENGLKDGDTLVLFNDNPCSSDNVKVCIFKATDDPKNIDKGKS